ncbi:hypothetical protein [Methyloversatilis sp.]|uniref:hypothetical protein n=1 Tax=Methyloversatilis sp. TaxID=2569862 RepID=UPI0035AEAD57
MGDFWVIRNKKSGEYWTIGFVTPRLYATKGRAEGQRKQLWNADSWEVIPVTLSEKVEQ